MATVLVTGAGGFLGGNIVCALREQGFDVRAMVRQLYLRQPWSGLPGVQPVFGDVCDRESLDRAASGVEAVIHTAALTRLMPRPRQDAFRVNVEGTRNVCEAAVRAGVRRLVFTSSAATLAAGTAERPADESSPFDRLGPQSPYYLSKWQAEQVVRGYAACGLQTVTLCPGYVIGPGDFRPTTNRLLLRVARSPALALPPGGINFIDVREAALAHVRAIRQGEPGQRYVLAGPYARYWDVALLVKRVLGQAVRGVMLPGWTEYPLAVPLAIAAGVWRQVPDALSVPGLRFGFVSFHMSGQRADAAFGLCHRPLEDSVRDALNWFGFNGRERKPADRPRDTRHPSGLRDESPLQRGMDEHGGCTCQNRPQDQVSPAPATLLSLPGLPPAGLRANCCCARRASR